VPLPGSPQSLTIIMYYLLGNYRIWGDTASESIEYNTIFIVRV